MSKREGDNNIVEGQTLRFMSPGEGQLLTIGISIVSHNPGSTCLPSNFTINGGLT